MQISIRGLIGLCGQLFRTKWKKFNRKKHMAVVSFPGLAPCNVSVEKNDGNAADTTKLDSIPEKIDTTIDKGADTLKARFNNRTDKDERKDTTKK